MDSAQKLPKCPDSIPKMAALFRQLGEFWAQCSERPRIRDEVVRHWDGIVREWADNPSMVLAVRKSTSVRGLAVEHKQSRGQLVVADNSPAQWVFSQAYMNRTPKLDEIKRMLRDDCIPFTYATKSIEKPQMTYKRTLAICDNVNKSEWKLCHMSPVGLSTRIHLTDIPIERLKEHFISLMSPSNLFLVPKRWAGLGEIPEFIQEINQPFREEFDTNETSNRPTV